MLFKAYCTHVCGCLLWSTLFQYSYNKLRIAYNDVFTTKIRGGSRICEGVQSSGGLKNGSLLVGPRFIASVRALSVVPKSL